MEIKEIVKKIGELEEVVDRQRRELTETVNKISALKAEKEYIEVISKYNETYWNCEDTYVYIKHMTMSSIENVVWFTYKGVFMRYDNSKPNSVSLGFSTKMSEYGSDLSLDKYWFMNKCKQITKQEFEDVFDAAKRQMMIICH